MRYVVLLFLVFFTLKAQEIVYINDKDVNIKDFDIGYISTNAKNYSINDVINKEFISSKNKASLGVEVEESWIKIVLFNETKDTKELFLHQNLAYMSTLFKYYEVDKNNNIINTHDIDILSSSSKNSMDGSNAIYTTTLKPNELKTIYIFLETQAYHYFNFIILDEKNSNKFLIYDKIDCILIVGILFSLAIYNLFIYLTTSYKEYLFYCLYLISSTLWITYVYGGLSHYFYLYGEFPARFNYGFMFSTIFLSFFVQSIFDTKTNYKIEHYFLDSIKIVMLVNVIYSFFDFNHSLQLLSTIQSYVLLVFLLVSISIYKKGNKIIKIFLLAHIFYLIFNLYGLLFYMGIVEFNYISSHAMGVGIILEALLLSYLVSYKFKILEEENKRAQLITFQKSKMADMGEMVANIAHQWRQPLAIINVSSAILREKNFLGKLDENDLDEELTYIDNNVSHMSQTIEDFLSYFKPTKQKESFELTQTINQALVIIENKIYKEQIKINLNIDECFIYGYKQEYIQVVISILTNAIQALEEKEKKVIEINSKNQKDKVVLEISDNGGGVKKDIINRIFEPYFTTKNETKGVGLGLYIAKSIIENNMDGKLYVSNTIKGAKFSIEVENDKTCQKI